MYLIYTEREYWLVPLTLPQGSGIFQQSLVTAKVCTMLKHCRDAGGKGGLSYWEPLKLLAQCWVDHLSVTPASQGCSVHH